MQLFYQFKHDEKNTVQPARYLTNLKYKFTLSLMLTHFQIGASQRCNCKIQLLISGVDGVNCLSNLVVLYMEGHCWKTLLLYAFSYSTLIDEHQTPHLALYFPGYCYKLCHSWMRDSLRYTIFVLLHSFTWYRKVGGSYKLSKVVIYTLSSLSRYKLIFNYTKSLLPYDTQI